MSFTGSHMSRKRRWSAGLQRVSFSAIALSLRWRISGVLMLCSEASAQHVGAQDNKQNCHFLSSLHRLCECQLQSPVFLMSPKLSHLTAGYRRSDRSLSFVSSVSLLWLLTKQQPSVCSLTLTNARKCEICYIWNPSTWMWGLVIFTFTLGLWAIAGLD